MNNNISLNNMRQQIGQTWLIVVFACVYVVSQVTILIILGPIEDAFIKLQTTGTSVADYVTVFNTWQASGDMALYRAHFILDDVHWIWYAALFTALLSRLFNRLEISPAYNWFLLLPLASGLLDWYENRLQHVFLSSTDFSAIIHPLPLYSTVASDIKWVLALGYIVATLVLAARLLLDGDRRRSKSEHETLQTGEQ